MTLQLSFAAPKVTIHNGRVVTTSQAVANYFDKRHDNVLRAIELLDCSEKFTALNFEVSEYTDTTGRKLLMYQMTKDGFVFLVMGFTGRKAAQFKEAYIAEFNRMEAELYAVPQHQPEAPELLSNNDDRNLARLVWRISNGFRFKRSWSNAVWFALRDVTGTASPQRFEVQHLPIIAQECRRIYYITSRFQDIIQEAEKQVIRRLLRKREDTETVLSEMKELFETSVQENYFTLTEKLDHWHEREVSQFLQRH